MTDKQKVKQFIEDLKEQISAMYNIKLLSIQETDDYKFDKSQDWFTYIKIKFVGGYHKEEITVVFKLEYEDINNDGKYLHMLAHYTLDFGVRVYDLFFGKEEEQ